MAELVAPQLEQLWHKFLMYQIKWLLRKLDSTRKSADVLLKCQNNASHKHLQGYGKYVQGWI